MRLLSPKPPIDPRPDRAILAIALSLLFSAFWLIWQWLGLGEWL